MNEGYAFGMRLKCYRYMYGLFEVDLIREANLDSSRNCIKKFEETGDSKFLADGDIERILSSSPLPVGFFDGTLEAKMLEIYRLMDSKHMIPESLLRGEGKNLVLLYQLGEDKRFPHDGYGPGYLRDLYLNFMLYAELYEKILDSKKDEDYGKDFEDYLIFPENIMMKMWEKLELDFNPKSLSHGDILKMHLRKRIRGKSPEHYSKRIFGDENIIWNLFHEHRFDKDTVNRLKRGKAWNFTTFKDYYQEFVSPAEAFKIYLHDKTVDNQSKDLLPPPDVFHPLGVLILYFFLKGAKPSDEYI